ncbi:MAG: hypothetical protein AAGN82_27170 [Myxococcota bacterium]
MLAWWLLAAAGASTQVGCADRRKVEECSALVTVINSGIDEVIKLTSATPDEGAAVEELRRVASEMDAVAARAAEVELTLSELQELSGQYQTMVTAIAAGSRSLADAVDNVDTEKMKQAREEIAKAVTAEDALVEQFNRFCQTP